VTSNPNMADGVALFHANHKILVSWLVLSATGWATINLRVFY